MAGDGGRAKSKKGSRFPSLNPTPLWRSWLEDSGLRRVLIALATASVAGLLSLDYVSVPEHDLAAGDIALRDVRATKTIQVVDEVATEEFRRQSMDQVRPVFDYDPSLLAGLERRIHGAFHALREELPAPAPEIEGEGAAEGVEAGEGDAPPAVVDPSPFGFSPESRDRFAQLLGLEVADETFLEIRDARFDESVEQDIRRAVRDALTGYVVFEADQLPSDMASAGISVKVLSPERPREVLLTRPGEITTLAEARLLAERSLDREADARSPGLAQAIATLTRSLLRTNLTYNASQTQERRQQARANIKPVTYTVKKGTVVVREGDPISEQSLVALSALAQAQERYRGGVLFVTVTAFAFLLFLILFQFASRFIRKFMPTNRDLLVMGGILSLCLTMARLGLEVAGALSAGSSSIALTSYYYLFPLAVGAMLIRILMNSETALIFSMAVGCSCALILDATLPMAIFFLLVSVTAAGGISHTKERLHVLRAGVLAGGMGAALAFVIELLSLTDGGIADALDPFRMFVDVSFAFTGGLFAAVMVLGLLPFFEMFGYVTDNKLLELANLNHPLLKEMMVQAPGSYHHSVIVGSLSEAACEAIGANALLARVGCYFHDIGKMKKASYFIENIRDQENKHDRLAPSMSALIIASHVKDGIELGRTYKLPESLIDLIPQHHGTALISFFFNKAKQLEDLDLSPVDENDYRYPGPRPQTREAGVVMLADATEASTRSIKAPTSAKIRANIQKIFNRILTDGQLDECPLTLRDLSVIADTFHDVLLGIYHTRIAYPPEYKPKGGRRVHPIASNLSQRLTMTQETKDDGVGDMAATQEVGPALNPYIPRITRPRAQGGRGETQAATTTADIPSEEGDDAPQAKPVDGSR